MGYIEAICISEKKGIPKKEIAKAKLVENWGIESDAHAGSGHRQISLLAGESIDNVRKLIPDLSKGAFAENIITRGISLTALKVGERIKVGEGILEITQIGKECHSGCVIQQITGDCIMPREGIFGRVIQGGEIKPQDKISLIEETK